MTDSQTLLPTTAPATEHIAPAAEGKPPFDPRTCPVQIRFAEVERDWTGKVTGFVAGPTRVGPGSQVISVAEWFKSQCAIDGRQEAEAKLQQAIKAWEKSGGRQKYDELAAQLEQTYRDAIVSQQLAIAYGERARELEQANAAPKEVLQWHDYARDEQAKAEALDRQAPVLQRQLARERELASQALGRVVQKTLNEYRVEHANEAHEIEARALAAFLPLYAEALRHRFMGNAADRELFDMTMNAVRFVKPPDPRQEQPRLPQANTHGLAHAVL